MFVSFHRGLAQPKNLLSDYSSVANFFMRWLAFPCRRGSEHSLKLLESVPLSTHASLALVRFEKETLVLGVTSQGVTLLTKGAPTDDVVSATEACDRRKTV